LNDTRILAADLRGGREVDRLRHLAQLRVGLPWVGRGATSGERQTKTG
jgi:hypothetical protein